MLCNAPAGDNTDSGTATRSLDIVSTRSARGNRLETSPRNSVSVPSTSPIVGESPELLAALDIVGNVAPTTASVLVLGETGTGKELIAREIHRLSTRSEMPLVSVNCASIPSELFESELFGHVAGSFTGATRNRTGRFETADGGSIFLDEVCEIPLEQQGKLLRVLQERELEKVGDTRPKKIDIRVIAATNRDPLREVERGSFREDLFYRLNVVPITVPPLRNRGSDILLLARHFLKVTCDKFDRGPFAFSSTQERELLRYQWPGNVRQLRNVIERSVALSASGSLEIENLTDSPRSINTTRNHYKYLTEQEFTELEKRNIEAALEVGRWRVSGRGGAADLLGVPPSTLTNRIRKLGISTIPPAQPAVTN